MPEPLRNEADHFGHDAAPHLYLLATTALFGSAFTGSKVVVGEMPHQAAAALRFSSGAVLLLALLLLLRSNQPFSLRDAVRAGLVGLLGVFAYNVFFFWGLSLAPALDGSIIVPVLSPVFATFYLVLAGRESANTARVTGLALGISGAVVFFIGAGVHAGITGQRLLGDFIYLLGALCWVAYSITSKRVLTGIDPLGATTFATLLGSLALVAVAIPSLQDTQWSAVSGGAWATLIYLAIGPTAGAYLFYYRALSVVSPSTATIAMFAVPVFGTVFSVIFLGESFTPLQVVGAIVMMGGAFLAVTQGSIRRT